MEATVTKRFTFEAAHHLPNHDGKCSRPHGHSYQVAVIVRGNINRRPGHPKEGMVMDFSDISAVWKEKIFPIVDHHDLNHIEAIGVTTAENIACWLLSMFRDNGVPITAVEVYETATSSARVSYAEVWANGQ